MSGRYPLGIYLMIAQNFKLSRLATPIVLTLLVGVGALSTGCATSGGMEKKIAAAEERKEWASRTAWTYIEIKNSPWRRFWVGILDKNLAIALQAANADFNEKIDTATASRLPDGGIGGMLASIEDNVAAAIESQEQYLAGGGSGLILLGSLIGPDGKALSANSSSGLEIKTFMGGLLERPELKDKWFYLSMTPKEAEAFFKAGGAGGGNAIQDGGQEFVYNTENLLVLNLNVGATRNVTDKRVDYKGVGDVAAPSTRTSSAIEGAAISYYYQPFLGEWITKTVELQRRDADTEAAAKKEKRKAA